MSSDNLKYLNPIKHYFNHSFCEMIKHRGYRQGKFLILDGPNLGTSQEMNSSGIFYKDIVVAQYNEDEYNTQKRIANHCGINVNIQFGDIAKVAYKMNKISDVYLDGFCASPKNYTEALEACAEKVNIYGYIMITHFRRNMSGDDPIEIFTQALAKRLPKCLEIIHYRNTSNATVYVFQLDNTYDIPLVVKKISIKDDKLLVVDYDTNEVLDEYKIDKKTSLLCI